MKFTTTIVAIMSVALLAAECSAQPPGRQRGEKGQNAAAGKRGERGQRGMGRGQDGAAQRSPADMAAKMMKEFDKDGDSKLSTRELVALLTAMQERRAAGGMAGANGQRKGPGQKPEGAGGGKAGGKGQRGKGQGDKPVGGGQKPKRPDAE